MRNREAIATAAMAGAMITGTYSHVFEEVPILSEPEDNRFDLVNPTLISGLAYSRIPLQPFQMGSNSRGTMTGYIYPVTGNEYSNAISTEGVSFYPFDAKLTSNLRHNDLNKYSLKNRISYLRDMREDEINSGDPDVFAFNHQSERSFWDFIEMLDVVARPALFLKDNGDLRAVWRSKKGYKISMQFTANSIVKFVLLDVKNLSSPKTIWGVESGEKIINILQNYGLLDDLRASVRA